MSGIIADVWCEPKPASNSQLMIDVMVSPSNIITFKKMGIRYRWKSSVIIQNVQKLIDKSTNAVASSKFRSTNEIFEKGTT